MAKKVPWKSYNGNLPLLVNNITMGEILESFMSLGMALGLASPIVLLLALAIFRAKTRVEAGWGKQEPKKTQQNCLVAKTKIRRFQKHPDNRRPSRLDSSTVIISFIKDQHVDYFLSHWVIVVNKTSGNILI